MGVWPSIILILVLDHISVAKSFGRLGNYYIQSYQEILVLVFAILLVHSLVVRLINSVIYPNAGYVAEKVTRLGKTRTRRGGSNRNVKFVPWNESIHTISHHLHQPLLGALVLDMAAVHSIDTTGLQALGCVRTTLERHAGQTMEWGFTGLQDDRIQHDLLTFGFGTLGDQSLMEISAPSSEHETQPSNKPTLSHSKTRTTPTLQQHDTAISMSTQQQLLRRGSIQDKVRNDEKEIVESWRSAAFMDLDMDRFSGRNSIYLEMDIDSYYICEHQYIYRPT
ncbi:unnamed protein product [Absidia cylindrospora]